MSLEDWEERVLASDGASERIAEMIAELRAAHGVAPAEPMETIPGGGFVKPGIAIA